MHNHRRPPPKSNIEFLASRQSARWRNNWQQIQLERGGGGGAFSSHPSAASFTVLYFIIIIVIIIICRWELIILSLPYRHRNSKNLLAMAIEARRVISPGRALICSFQGWLSRSVTCEPAQQSTLKVSARPVLPLPNYLKSVPPRALLCSFREGATWRGNLQVDKSESTKRQWPDWELLLRGWRAGSQRESGAVWLSNFAITAWWLCCLWLLLNVRWDILRARECFVETLKVGAMVSAADFHSKAMRDAFPHLFLLNFNKTLGLHYFQSQWKNHKETSLCIHCLLKKLHVNGNFSGNAFTWLNNEIDFH